MQKNAVFQPVNTGFKTESATIGKRIYKSRYLLMLFLPCLIYYIIFKYVPMWGVAIAFKDFKAFKGFFASNWAGLKYFKMFFSSADAFVLIKNTFMLGFYTLVWGFPIPIIFALVLNEVKKTRFKKLVQTVTYMPHFISEVIVVGMVIMFLSPTSGVINNLMELLGGERINFLVEPKYFRSIYIISGLWKDTGWGAIIYLAALAGIDPQLYESALMDGANKWKQIIYITLPSIAPTIITMLILKTGGILDVGFEKVLLLQNPAIYSTSDVISTYVYRQGLMTGNMSYGSAVGLFNSIINLIFIYVSNYMARRYSETSLW